AGEAGARTDQLDGDFPQAHRLIQGGAGVDDLLPPRMGQGFRTFWHGGRSFPGGAAYSSISSYSRLPVPSSAAASMVWMPLRLLTRSIKCSLPGSSDCMTRSMQAWSMATGSSEARMPMSFMQGSSATAQQSQSTERFFITLMKAILPLKCSTTLWAASAIASGNWTGLACCSQVLYRSSVAPAEWISALPPREAQPMASCLSA